jgi:hypothetical protein
LTVSQSSTLTRQTFRLPVNHQVVVIPMVRLVFRPYTQIRRSICTSESLRASTRVSSGFTLFRHSSPSFGSQHTCSTADASQKVCSGRRCSPRQGSQLSLSLRARVFHPNTRRHVRLLGPCFKTGRLKPLCQHPKHVRGTSTRPCGVLSSSIPADVCDPEL